MGSYVTLSSWILLSTLDRQLNKKTHQLPMCLHGSWFNWKQWEGWTTECAKTTEWRLGLGPPHWAPGRRRKIAIQYSTHKVPLSISIRHLIPFSALLDFNTSHNCLISWLFTMHQKWARTEKILTIFLERRWPFQPACQIPLCAAKPVRWKVISIPLVHSFLPVALTFLSLLLSQSWDAETLCRLIKPFPRSLVYQVLMVLNLYACVHTSW